MATIRIHEQEYQVDSMLFDKDGTLLEFGTLWLPWLDRLIRQYNEEAPAGRRLTSAVETAMGVNLSAGTWDPTGPFAIGSMDDVQCILAQDLYAQGVAWNDALKQLATACAELAVSFDLPGCLVPVAGLKGFLQQAFQAGIKMGVVTSDDARNADQHLTILGIDHYFGVVLGHDTVAWGKPHPDMALAACSRLGVAPGRTIVFGDSNGDMQMARDAGLQAGIGIERFGDAMLTVANQVIPDYRECRVF